MPFPGALSVTATAAPTEQTISQSVLPETDTTCKRAAPGEAGHQAQLGYLPRYLWSRWRRTPPQSGAGIEAQLVRRRQPSASTPGCAARDACFIDDYDRSINPTQGYLDEISLRPGQQLTARLRSDAPVTVELVRLRHSDPNPKGPGVVEDRCTWPGLAAGSRTHAASRVGSFARVPTWGAALRGAEVASPSGSFTLAGWLYPTSTEGEQHVFSWRGTDEVVSLLLKSDGRLALRSGDDDVIVASHRLHQRIWWFVGASVGDDHRAAQLFYGQLGRTGGPFVVSGSASGSLMPSFDSALYIAAAALLGGEPLAGCLDGKVAAPSAIAGVLDVVDLMDLMNRDLFTASAREPRFPYLARWDFADGCDVDVFRDTSGKDHHGELFNAPSRGASDHLTEWRHPSGELSSSPAAVHFHRDDVDDVGWEPTAAVQVPDDARSGLYALRCASRGGQLDLPFVVAPRPGDSPPVLLLAPTYTWQAYANLGRRNDLWPGPSIYALHSDGSPVYICSRRKPTSTFSPNAYLEVDAGDGFAGGEPAGVSELRPTHLLMADLYVNFWLESTGVEFAVATDEHLHQQGRELLSGVDTLVLSAHPEYWTARMLDALSEHVSGGGNVMYLGGNGLYWVTSVHPNKPHLIEVRRRAGSQTSGANPVEVDHSFEPRPGGTWRDSHRPPNASLGVGFAGFGWQRGIGYRRTERGRSPEFAWVFEGVEDDPIGDVGLNMGGAVAIEFDRCDPEEGSAADVVVLATATPEAPGFFRAFEFGPGRAPDPAVRCDMTLWRLPSGGRVFSLSSIAASGCLTFGHPEGALARVCTNVLRDFVGPSGRG